MIQEDAKEGCLDGFEFIGNLIGETQGDNKEGICEKEEEPIRL